MFVQTFTFGQFDAAIRTNLQSRQRFFGPEPAIAVYLDAHTTEIYFVDWMYLEYWY